MVKDKLIQYAKAHAEDPNRVYVRYINERFLYRLSISRYKDRFAVKGAMVFYFWGIGSSRPTRDIDLLGFYKDELDGLKEIIKEICLVKDGINDEVIFNEGSIETTEIRKLTKYGGICVTGKCKLVGVGREIPFQIDVGYGDIITPGVEVKTMEPILDFPAPELKIYSVETVIAEKFEAMVNNGIQNSRVKDYWDVYALINNNEIDVDLTVLKGAIQNTFKRRKTEFKELIPGCLTDEYYSNERRINQWNKFLRVNGLKEGAKLQSVVESLRATLLPIYEDLYAQRAD